MSTIVTNSFANECERQYTNIAHSIAHRFQNNQTTGIGLLTGLSGEAISLLYYAQLTQNQSYYDLGCSVIEKIIDKIPASTVSHTHCAGLAGFGWSLMHLDSYNLLDIDLSTLLEEVDAFLENSIQINMHQGNWDFLHGALGTALYFLKRRKYTGKADEILRIFIRSLEAKAICEKDAVKWPSRGNAEKPVVFNISLSHGMSAVIAFLSKLYKEGIECRKVKKMIQGTVSYILQQQLDTKKYASNFPSYSIESHDVLTSSRLAWCYGDLGIASTLWMAGESLENNGWKEKAVDVFLHAATRTNREEMEIRDGGLCHGTAGIAHVFNRAYRNTGMIEFASARNHWLAETQKMAIYEDGLAGYKAWNGQEKGYLSETNLLEGIAGIGLSYLTALHPEYMAWDECLLLS
jgi:lantibiotic biosynthesis protein